MTTPAAYFRLARVGWVLVREGVVATLPVQEMPPSARFLSKVAGLFARRRSAKEGRSARLAHAIERLGPSYVKMGQFLATRPDVVGVAIAEDLSALQDRMASFPMAEAKATVEGSLGRPVSDLYVRFDEPIAAASIAQVHPAVVRD